MSFSFRGLECKSWVQFSRSVVSDSLQFHESQHTRPPYPSQTHRVYSNTCPSSRWCHPAISSSVIPFSSCQVGNQETPGVTGQFGLGVWNEAGQGLIEFCQENALVIANTLFQQHKRRLYTWTSPDDQYRNPVHYILCSQRWRSSIQSAKRRLETDCGSDHEHLIAKFRLKLRKVGKTSRPFRYDLNQIPYDYAVEVRNRFKG